MATYICVSQDDHLLELATVVATLKSKDKDEPDHSFLESCEKMIADKPFEVISKVLDEKQIIFSQIKEVERLESFFLVLMAFLQKRSTQEIDSVLNKILEAITSDSKDRPIFRLKLLSDLHNILIEGKHKLAAFSAALTFAISSKQIRLLESYLTNLDDRLTSYQAKPDQIQNIVKMIRNYYREIGSKNLELEWTIKYLRLFEKGTNETEPEAIIAIVNSIKAPGVYQFDNLLQLPAVKALESGSGNSQKAVQLLKVFINGNLVALQEYALKNGDFLKANGVDMEESTRKLQLLTLCSLAVTNNTLSYSAIAKALQINESEVETWVINGIGENVLDAKLDQQKQMVLVNRCLHRVLTQENWKQLSQNLTSWKTGILGIQKVLGDCSQQQAALFSRIPQQMQH
jgi:translation initiation factor 3 subunit M